MIPFKSLLSMNVLEKISSVVTTSDDSDNWRAITQGLEGGVWIPNHELIFRKFPNHVGRSRYFPNHVLW